MTDIVGCVETYRDVDTLHVYIGSDVLPAYFYGTFTVSYNDGRYKGLVGRKNSLRRGIANENVFRWCALPNNVDWQMFKELNFLTDGHKGLLSLENGPKFMEHLQSMTEFREICAFIEYKEAVHDNRTSAEADE